MENKTFDDYLDNKIGLGKYHYICLAMLSLADLSDGIVNVLNSLLNPIIKSEFNLSTN